MVLTISPLSQLTSDFLVGRLDTVRYVDLCDAIQASRQLNSAPMQVQHQSAAR